MNDEPTEVREETEKPEEAIPEIVLHEDIASDISHSILRIRKGHKISYFALFLFFGAVLWLVPGLISLLEGSFLPRNIPFGPYAFDLSMYVLFFFSTPLLVSTGDTFSTLQNRIIGKLIAQGVFRISREDYSSLVGTVNLLMANKWIHGLVFLSAFGTSIAWAVTMICMDASTWHGTAFNGCFRTPSLALIYIAVVSMPVALYVIYSWTWKAFVWSYFSWRMSKAGIRVNAFHPDGSGGIGSLKYSSIAWGTFIICIGGTIAADTLNYSYVMKMSILRWDIFAKIGSYCFLSPLVFVFPLLCLTPSLVKAKMEGQFILNAYATDYANEIREFLKGRPKNEPPSRKQDYWSGMCDFLTVFNLVRGMKLWPFDLRSGIRILVTVVGPLCPLLLPQLPIVSDFLDKIFG